MTAAPIASTLCTCVLKIGQIFTWSSNSFLSSSHLQCYRRIRRKIQRWLKNWKPNIERDVQGHEMTWGGQKKETKFTGSGDDNMIHRRVPQPL